LAIGQKAKKQGKRAIFQLYGKRGGYKLILKGTASKEEAGPVRKNEKILVRVR